MTINFPVLKSQKFQIGDIVYYESKDHFTEEEFIGIVTGSYGRNSYKLYVPKWLNPDIKKTAPNMKLPDTFAWASNRELTFIRNLKEEEKIKFLAEFYRVYISLS